MEELEDAQELVGEFGADNRAGIEGTLHRISAIRNRKGFIVGLTCRVGRAVSGHIDMLYDLLHYGKSILFVGRPGVGKTTVLREMARVLSDEFQKRVVVFFFLQFCFLAMKVSAFNSDLVIVKCVFR